MRAATTPTAHIGDHRDNDPNQVDPRDGEPAIDLPRVNDRGYRQENKPQQWNQHLVMVRASQIVRQQKHQHQNYARKEQDEENEKAGHLSDRVLTNRPVL